MCLMATSRAGPGSKVIFGFRGRIEVHKTRLTFAALGFDLIRQLIVIVIVTVNLAATWMAARARLHIDQARLNC